MLLLALCTKSFCELIPWGHWFVHTSVEWISCSKQRNTDPVLNGYMSISQCVVITPVFQAEFKKLFSHIVFDKRMHNTATLFTIHNYKYPCFQKANWIYDYMMWIERDNPWTTYILRVLLQNPEIWSKHTQRHLKLLGGKKNLKMIHLYISRLKKKKSEGSMHIPKWCFNTWMED